MPIAANKRKLMTIVDVQTYTALEKLAREQERTISAMAALALRDYLRDRGFCRGGEIKARRAGAFWVKGRDHAKFLDQRSSGKIFMNPSSRPSRLRVRSILRT